MYRCVTPTRSQTSRRLTRRTLRHLARKRFGGVAGLAAHIGRNRVTVYSALRDPARYGPTLAAIRDALDL